MPLTFSMASYGIDGISSYDAGDSLRNNTISSATFDGNNFSWTPQTQDVGTHNISIYGMDSSGKLAIAEAKITVNVISTSQAASAISSLNGTNTTPTPSRTVFKSYLSLGSSGSEVKALQNYLAEKNYFSGSATGYFGTLTQKAVKAFQKANGTSPLGVVGPATRALLNK
jgi:hypothetical protein